MRHRTLLPISLAVSLVSTSASASEVNNGIPSPLAIGAEISDVVIIARISDDVEPVFDADWFFCGYSVGVSSADYVSGRESAIDKSRAEGGFLRILMRHEPNSGDRLLIFAMSPPESERETPAARTEAEGSKCQQAELEFPGLLARRVGPVFDVVLMSATSDISGPAPVRSVETVPVDAADVRAMPSPRVAGWRTVNGELVICIRDGDCQAIVEDLRTNASVANPNGPSDLARDYLVDLQSVKRFLFHVDVNDLHEE